MHNSQDPLKFAKTKSLFGGKWFKEDVAEGNADLPLVTVITAVYNGQPYVAECMESILRQDYPNIEHIVLDGGSSDGTVDVLRKYDDRIALWKSEPDRGIYDAWNKGLALARGEWICFLGADDEFLSGAVSAYMEFASQNPVAEYLCSKVKLVDTSGHQKIIGRAWKWPEFSKYMCTAHVGSMHRRSLYDRLGTYDVSYSIVADYELLLRAQGGLKAAFMPIETAMMRAGGVSGSTWALNEAARAKVSTGKRNKALAAFELQLARVKYMAHLIIKCARIWWDTD